MALSLMTEVRTTLRLPEDLLTEFKHIAIDEKRTLTDLISEAMRDYLHKKNRK